MTRFAFVTWDGGGNVTPAVGMAQELVSRGHDVVFIGYEVQRKRFEGKGLKFAALRRSGQFDIYGASDPAERIAGLMANVWACPEHLDDVPDAVAATSADVLVVDFSMHGALASATKLPVPFAVLAHSSIAGLVPPPEQSPIGAARLTATNRLRDGAGLPALARLNEAWTGCLTLVTTIPALDPAAAGADICVHYIGPVFESFPGERWDSPWDHDDDRPMVLVSFTTTGLWDQSGRIRNTLEALSGEAGTELLDGESEPATIRVAVHEVMGQPSYAAAAGNLAIAIQAAPGVAGAAVELERLALTGGTSPV
jgi:UDP:flavonoid glycosyltransferase YjiC (YdhE family)